MWELTAAAPVPVSERGTRYLVFELGGEEYAVDVLKVREITGPLPITRLPRTPPAVRGVLNLRGKVIPVVDLRVGFGMDAIDHGPRTCMIVVQTATGEFAALVDRVCEVAEIADGQVEDAPAIGRSAAAACLLGVARTGDRVRLLLDIDRALARDALEGTALPAGSDAEAPPAA